MEAIQYDGLTHGSGEYAWSSTGHGTDGQSDYYAAYKYDSNGNIREIKRNAYGTTNTMDDLFFHLKSHNNQLTRAVDGVMGTPFNTDLADGQAADNYEYDLNGSLISDASEQIAEIDWTASGKVKRIERTAGSEKDDLIFFYDGLGNRYAKVAITKNGSGDALPITEWNFTYYVRDAQGNELELYNLSFADLGGYAYLESLTLEERNWYGSSRLGNEALINKLIAEADFDVDAGDYPFNGNLDDKQNVVTTIEPIETKNFTLLRGRKQYELTNHLGNVLATVSDKRFAIDGKYSWVEGASETGAFRFYDGAFTSTGTMGKNYVEDESPDDVDYDFYRPNITMANRYYPFGMVQPRDGNLEEPSGGYRFGFQGQEKENEIASINGGHLSFAHRIHDARLGRFLSTDPIASNYPWNSPYAFAENRVIDGVDLEGLEYLDSDASRLNIMAGIVYFKIENANFFTYRPWKNASNNQHTATEIGFATPVVGELEFSEDISAESMVASPVNRDFVYENEIDGVSPARTTRRAGDSHGATEFEQKGANRQANRDIARKGAPIVRATPIPGAKGYRNVLRPTAGVLTLVLNVVNFGVEHSWQIGEVYESYRVQKDLIMLDRARQDLVEALNRDNGNFENSLIPRDYRNVDDLSAILNVILQGENNTKNPNIFEIGMRIWNEISVPKLDLYKGQSGSGGGPAPAPPNQEEMPSVRGLQ